MSISSVRGGFLVVAAVLLVWVPMAQATSFTVFTYNVKGIPAQIELADGSFVDGNLDSPNTIPRIVSTLGSNLSNYDVVAIQEAFDPGYFADINALSSNTPAFDFDTRPEPPPLIFGGSGLTRLSQDPYSDYVRVPWVDCGVNREDCFSTKGFSMARHTIGGGSVDIYNLHADAGQEPEDRDARASQFAQLASYIGSESADNAVIVLGDFNSLYTRALESFGSFLTTTSLSDAWVELINGGQLPTTTLSGCINSAEHDPSQCERIDKVLFRGSATLALIAESYLVPDTLFLDNRPGMTTNQLSDHRPVIVGFNAFVVPEPGTATLLAIGLSVLAVRGRR